MDMGETFLSWADDFQLNLLELKFVRRWIPSNFKILPIEPTGIEIGYGRCLLKQYISSNWTYWNWNSGRWCFLVPETALPIEPTGIEICVRNYKSQFRQPSNWTYWNWNQAKIGKYRPCDDFQLNLLELKCRLYWKKYNDKGFQLNLLELKFVISISSITASESSNWTYWNWNSKSFPLISLPVTSNWTYWNWNELDTIVISRPTMSSNWTYWNWNLK